MGCTLEGRDIGRIAFASTRSDESACFSVKGGKQTWARLVDERKGAGQTPGVEFRTSFHHLRFVSSSARPSREKGMQVSSSPKTRGRHLVRCMTDRFVPHAASRVDRAHPDESCGGRRADRVLPPHAQDGFRGKIIGRAPKGFTQPSGKLLCFIIRRHAALISEGDQKKNFSRGKDRGPSRASSPLRNFFFFFRRSTFFFPPITQSEIRQAISQRLPGE